MIGDKICHQSTLSPPNMQHDEEPEMKIRAINPWDWSQQLGYSQAISVQDFSQILVCAGQTATDPHGAPLHPNDMRAQMNLAIENLRSVLTAANMTFDHIIQLKIYTTNVKITFQNYDLIAKEFREAKTPPATTLLGVSALAHSDLMFELEATAAL